MDKRRLGGDYGAQPPMGGGGGMPPMGGGGMPSGKRRLSEGGGPQGNPGSMLPAQVMQPGGSPTSPSAPIGPANLDQFLADPAQQGDQNGMSLILQLLKQGQM